LKVKNATSAFLATCLLLIATALGQLWRYRALMRTYKLVFRVALLLVYLRLRCSFDRGRGSPPCLDVSYS
jgi:hypothetical protein